MSAFLPHVRLAAIGLAAAVAGCGVGGSGGVAGSGGIDGVGGLGGSGAGGGGGVDLCAGRFCPDHQRCDPADGVCKCGAVVCVGAESCLIENPATGPRCRIEPCTHVRCEPGMRCDFTDGLCKCGGLICSFGDQCVEDVCTFDPCADVNCGPSTLCNPEDRRCHCGDPFGPICEPGEVCADGGDTWVCFGGDR